MRIDLSITRDDIEAGAKLTKKALAARLNRDPGWLNRQGTVVRARGETWEAQYKNGGRIAGYTLLARLEPQVKLVSSVPSSRLALRR